MPLRYTIRGQPAQIGDPAATTYPFSARYTYNPNSTLLETEFRSSGSPATQKRYRYGFSTYDALNRIKGAGYTGFSGSTPIGTLAYDLASITYDLSGNIKAMKRYRDAATLIDNLTYTYPSTSNRLSSVTDAVAATTETWDAETGSFTYDPNGNIATAPAPYSITAVTYNHQNLPVSLTRSGVTTTYRYDEAGQRLTKQVGTGNSEVYLREGATTLSVVTVNSAGTAASWYFNLVSESHIVGRQPNTGSRSYYHLDMLGNTRAVVQGSTVVESYDYDPWGVLLAGRTLGSGTKEGFGGKEQDTETGLSYFGARYYMPALGRWAAVDPLADGMPQWSPYNYVYDNPGTLTDPFGLCPDKTPGWICIAFFIPTPTAALGTLKGDNRDFMTLSHPRQSRAYAIIDPERPGMAMAVVNPTCSDDNSHCTASVNTAADFKVTPNEEGGFHLHVAIKASTRFKRVTPRINAEIDVQPDGKGGYTATGTRDGYPASEGYYTRPDGTTQELFKGEAQTFWSLYPPMELKIEKKKEDNDRKTVEGGFQWY